MDRIFIVLGFNRIAGIDPGLQATQDGADTRIAAVQKDERRTGARVFIKSGTVGNDPFVLIERQIGRIRLDCAQRNLQRACDMTSGVGVRAAHIHNDRITAVERGFGLICRYARNFCISLWQVGRRLGGDRFRELCWNQDLSRHDRLY